MDNYNGLVRSFGTNTVKVSLQAYTYKGAFYYRVGGDIKGFDVLNYFDIEDACEEDVEEWGKENCEIELYEEDGEYYWDVKIGTKEDYWHCDCIDDNDFSKLIVGIEIVSFEEEKS